jgi:hypothetical protein
MINSSTIRNSTIPFPVVEGLTSYNPNVLGKIKIKNIYHQWHGQNMPTIKDQHECNPYMIRIGKPSVDQGLRNDPVYFILHYLSYNQITKDIERRELIPLRNMEKIYVGQSLDEAKYKDYRMFVDGNVVADDLYLKKYEGLDGQPLGKMVLQLIETVEKLRIEMIQLKRNIKTSTIYK